MAGAGKPLLDGEYAGPRNLTRADLLTIRLVIREEVRVIVREEAERALARPDPEQETLAGSMDDVKKRLFLATLQKNNWNQKASAAALNMSPRAFTYQMGTLGILTLRQRLRAVPPAVPSGDE